MNIKAMRRRTRARECAVQFLYQLDLRRESDLEGLDDFLETESKDREARSFARRLIEGTMRHRDETDAVLRKVARNWDLERMAVLDRNVLRMAVHELLHCDDIPPKVTINEAIELGKKFSTANSGGFINGILDRIRLDYVGVEPPVATAEAGLATEHGLQGLRRADPDPDAQDANAVAQES